MLRCFERIGFYQTKGFVEKDVLYMVASGRIITMWSGLQDVVAIHRSAAGGRAWENFEALYNDTKSYMQGRGFDTATVESRHRETGRTH